MTLEFSLRKRAKQARLIAMIWLTVASILLAGTYLSIPAVINKELISFDAARAEATIATKIEADKQTVDQHSQILAIATLVIGVLTIFFACYLLGRCAFVEIVLAARFSGLADALCISGGDFEMFEKASAIMVPAAKYLPVSEILSSNDIKVLLEAAKQAKG